MELAVKRGSGSYRYFTQREEQRKPANVFFDFDFNFDFNFFNFILTEQRTDSQTTDRQIDGKT